MLDAGVSAARPIPRYGTDCDGTETRMERGRTPSFGPRVLDPGKATAGIEALQDPPASGCPSGHWFPGSTYQRRLLLPHTLWRRRPQNWLPIVVVGDLRQPYVLRPPLHPVASPFLSSDPRSSSLTIFSVFSHHGFLVQVPQ